MELLRRSLLLGCVLPALWLLRLATLDPLVSIVRVDPAAQPATAQPEATVAVSGPVWEAFLRGIDAIEQGLGNGNHWRVSADLPTATGTSRWVFYTPDEKPIRALDGKLDASGGTTFVSIARRDGDVRYRVDRREWTHQEFQPGPGFIGKPAPPASLLYPFQNVAYACLIVGVLLFALIPTPTKSRGGVSPAELILLGIGLLLFAGPLFATGGSVQALTDGLVFTLPCWVLAAVAFHFFAKPGTNAPHPLVLGKTGTPGADPAESGHLPTFLRWGTALLAVAAGPIAALVAVSMTYWNR
jgi:hypothetical protein